MMQFFKQQKHYIVLAVALLLGTASGVAFYRINMLSHSESISKEADRMLALTSSYVSRYSKIRAQSGSHLSPVPAEFRAQAAQMFNDNYDSESRFTARMVGAPVNYIKTPPTDPEMAATLNRMLDNKGTSVFSEVLHDNGQAYVRTMYPSFATEQSCVNCHNEIQKSDTVWKKGDLMGAYVVENGIESFIAKYQLFSFIIGFLVSLTLASVYVASSFYRDLMKRAMELRRLASTDPLTGCFNRREFSNRINDASKSQSANSALLLLDIDHFKMVNDTHGHNKGDQVLISFVKTVQKSLRRKDILARAGGEEFYVYLPDTSEDDAKSIAERIKQSVALDKYDHDSSFFSITVSIGALHTSHAPHQSLSLYSRVADMYLYKDND